MEQKDTWLEGKAPGFSPPPCVLLFSGWPLILRLAGSRCSLPPSEPTLFAATSGVRARRRRVCDPTQSGSVSKTFPIREIRCAISSPEIRSAWAI